jgi:hypothetical protein
MNQGFFEFELRSGDRTFIATVELLPPGLEASEARAKVPEVWELYFAAPEVIVPKSTTCVDSRPIQTKPDDALKVPKVLPRCSSGNRKRNSQNTFYPTAGVGRFF